MGIPAHRGAATNGLREAAGKRVRPIGAAEISARTRKVAHFFSRELRRFIQANHAAIQPIVITSNVCTTTELSLKSSAG